MDDLRDTLAPWNWTAIGTMVLAVVTLLLAGATVWLGWNTRSMATETRRMAASTEALANIEALRREQEVRAALVVSLRSWIPRSDIGFGTQMITRIQNESSADAWDILVFMREGEKLSVKNIERLASRGVAEIPEHEFRRVDVEPMGTEVEAAARPGVQMQIRWEDASGVRQSPVYRWSHDTGAPDVIDQRREAWIFF